MFSNYAQAVSNARPTAVKPRTSAATPMTLSPAAASELTAVSTFSCLRLATDTFAPCLVPATPKLISVVPPKDEDVLVSKVERERHVSLSFVNRSTH